MGCILSVCKPSRIDASSPAETINKGIGLRAEKSDGDDMCEGLVNACGSEIERERGIESGVRILMMRDRKVVAYDNGQNRQPLSRVNQFGEDYANNKRQSQSSFLTVLFNKKRAIKSSDLKPAPRSDCKKFRANRRVSAALNDSKSSDRGQVIVPETKFTTTGRARVRTSEQVSIKMQANKSTREHYPIEQLSEDAQSASSSNDFPKNINNKLRESIKGDDSQQTEDKINLFTSVQQLCSGIINCRLLSGLEQERQDNGGVLEGGKVLCLFTFSCQGSNKGEISFELVEHSSILKLLTRDEINLEDDFDCPLYHHIDVAALIVANIDERIREYNELAAQSLKLRLEQQSELLKTSNGENVTLSQVYRGQLNNEDRDGDGDRQSDNTEDQTLTTETDKDQSTSSDLSPSTSMIDLKQQLHHVTDDFGLITLSTKQRSILQLKLMKYFNSITSKWVFQLIQNEVGRLELKLKEKLELIKNSYPNNNNNNNSAKRFKIPDRVYLINLVPNQLSLFKSCLYLHQDISIKDSFKYPFYAMKFERRTNIKLLTKEHAANKVNPSNKQNSAASSLRLPHISIANLKLPMLNMRQVTACDSLDVENWAKSSAQTLQLPNCHATNTNNNDSKANLAAMATDVLADGVNEKLGPKFNDSFVSQFESMNKLIKVRYNQTHDYNYMTIDDNYMGNSCFLKLRTMNMSYNNADGQFRCWSAQPMMMIDAGGQSSSDENFASHLGETNLQLSASMQNLQETSNDSNFHLNESLTQKSHCLSVSSAQDLMKRSISNCESPDQYASTCVSSNSSIPSNVADNNDDKQEHYIGVQQFQVRAIIPCAVELELFDSLSNSSKSNDQAASKGSTKWHHLRPSSGVNEQVSSQQKSQHLDNHNKQSDRHHHSSSAPLAVYYEPKRASSRSSSIIFIKSQQQKQQQSNSSPGTSSPSHSPSPLSPNDCYQLVPVRVAYANNQSQLMLEAKRVYNRQLKLKSSSDLARLVKYINKVKIKLKLDCENWLMDTIISKSKRIETEQIYSAAVPPPSPSSGQHLSSSIGVLPTEVGLHRKARHSVAGATQQQQQHHHHHLYDNLAEMYRDPNQMPALIVYTIRVDISRIKSGNFQYPSNFHPNIEDFLATETIVDDAQRGSTTKIGPSSPSPTQNRNNLQLVPILKINDNLNLETIAGSAEQAESVRPHSAKSLNNGHYSREFAMAGDCNRRGEKLKVRPASSLASSDRQIRPRRHVQFRLSQAPGNVTATRWNDHSAIQAQHRKWIDSQLFVSLTSNDDDEYSRNSRNSSLVTLVGDLIRCYVSDGARGSDNGKD